ncbi:MAG TPA: LCP family protein [Dehalococcoidia bacterium]|nr:LCP family protein [Dehalococcoidia bacterium]
MSEERFARYRYYTTNPEVPMRRKPAPTHAHRPRGERSFLMAGVGFFFIASLYTALMVISRVDQLFLPGNEISFASIGLGDSGIPGIAEPDSDPITRRINLLVMGIDKRPQDDTDELPPRADTIMVVTIDPKTKTAGVLGIPRDLYVEIPDGNGGVDNAKINTANNRSNGGPELVMEVVENTLGIQLDNYLVVDFVAFQDFIDALGGIEVEANEDQNTGRAIYYDNYSIDDIEGEPLEIEPGLQHMDGYTALAYSRYREDSDFHRIKRQQQVIFATLDKAFGTGLIADPGALKGLYDTWRDTVDTDISSLRVPGLALLAQEIPEERITRASLGDAVEDDYIGGEYVARLRVNQAQQIIDLLFRDPRIINEAATIEILNGSNREGLARLERDRFVDRGIPEANIINIANAPSDYDWINTLILVRTPGKDFTASRLARWLGLDENRIRTAGEEFAYLSDSTADIIVVLGTEVTDSQSGEEEVSSP